MTYNAAVQVIGKQSMNVVGTPLQVQTDANLRSLRCKYVLQKKAIQKMSWLV